MNRFEDAIQPHRKTTIEAQARQDADAADLRYPEEGSKEPDWLVDSVGYWDQVVRTGEIAVYRAAYQRRIDRRMRVEK